jgi:hypothetical protein
MIDVIELVRTVFSGLSALVIEDVGDAGDVICVRARTRDVAVACRGAAPKRPACMNTASGRRRTFPWMAAASWSGCGSAGCAAQRWRVQTFREQVPGVLDRYQRRISRLTAQVSAVARELAGRASARLLPALGIMVCRHTALRVLLKIPLPA